MLFNRCLVIGFGLLPASLAWGQYFTPVSTFIDASTSAANYIDNTTTPGPDDYEDFGDQIGTLQASSQLDYMGTTSAANGLVSIDPETGVINVTLNATTNGGDPYPNLGGVTTIIAFDVPPNSGLHLGLDLTGIDNLFGGSNSTLEGPDGLSWQEVSSEDIPSVPAGEYTLTCQADSFVVAMFGRDTQNLTTITIFPEPSGSMLAGGILSLIPIRRRKI